MSIMPEQCSMARAGLYWSQTELSRRFGVAPAIIAAPERRLRNTYPRTVRDLEVAFETAGVKLINGGTSVARSRNHESRHGPS